MPMFRPFLAIAGAALLAGCTVGPDYRPPQTPVAPGWVEAGTPGEVDLQWWERFSDPQLTALVARAVASSPDLREAEARVREARANRDATAGGRLPAVEAKGSATQNVLSENGQLPIANIPGFERDFPLFDLGFDASWEVDLWGRRTRQLQAADAQVAAAGFERGDAMLSLIGELVRAYLDLRAAQADQASVEALAASDTELARLAGLRFRAGEASRLELERAQATERTSAASAPETRARGAAAAYRIAALIGVAPEQVVPELLVPRPLPTAPDTILIGVRSDLLVRRPDVRRAERELAAATAEIGVATADLFPRFSLFGSVGQQARDPADLLSSGSTRLQIGPSFSWPIFSAGRIRAQIRAADARAEAAAARYEKAVTGALSDSEAAINRFLNTRAVELDAAAALEREQAAFALAERRASQGEDDRLTLERARQALLAARRRADQARAAKAEAAVALFKALGGGWR
jgi:multidrug efflux system outer membrane protein